MLENKIIIVTGGLGLLGKEMILNLKSKGAIAICADISIDTNLEAHSLQFDVTSEDSVLAGFNLVKDHFGRIDGIVNSAYPRTKDWGQDFSVVKMESWKQNIDLQLNSVCMICQKALPFLEDSKGSIVNMASIYGMVGPTFNVYNNTSMTMTGGYAAIKGGIINFTKFLAAYMGPKGVRVNVVSPGGIFDNQNETFVEQYNDIVPMKRMGFPEDIAPSVSFLLSDEAKYITGHNLVVDGGWTCI